MGKWFLGMAAAVCFAVPSVAQVSVTVSKPMNATATSTRKITGWWIYVDNKPAWNNSEDVGTVLASVSMANGDHLVRVRAWDSSGAFGDYYLALSVSGQTSLSTAPTSSSSSALPTPPSTAKVLSNLEETTDNWWSCTAPCAGGRVSENYSTELTWSPVLEGQSREFFNGGGPYSNVLWVKKGLGEQNYASNFLWDLRFYVDERTSNSVYGLEYDLWLAQDRWEYMIGTQAHYPSQGNPGHWDTWSQAEFRWVHNYDKVAPRFKPNTWHRLQWHMKRDHSRRSYTYVTLVIDAGMDSEQVIKFNQTQYAGRRDWADSFGVQWQMNLNKYGIDARQWIDKVKVTLW